MRYRIGILLLIFVLLVGCNGSAPITDSKSQVDLYVKQMLADHPTKKALAYLAEGGHHVDLYPEAPSTVDRDLLVPLLQRLRTEFKLDPIAILEKDEEAGDEYIWEIVMKIPEDSDRRARIQDAIRATDASFEGRILTEWGNEWLSIAFDEPDSLD